MYTDKPTGIRRDVMSLKKKKKNPENNWHWLSSWAVGYEETDTGV